MTEKITLDYYSLDTMAERLHEGEPVFVLRAADIKSVEFVLQYGQRLVQDSLATQEQFNKGVSALHIAHKMTQWQLGNPDKVKLPDNPADDTVV